MLSRAVWGTKDHGNKRAELTSTRHKASCTTRLELQWKQILILCIDQEEVELAKCKKTHDGKNYVEIQEMW